MAPLNGVGKRGPLLRTGRGKKTDELTRTPGLISSPVILRSTSNFTSGLSSYLQCLYAVPSFRNAILEYAAPLRARVDFPDYRDYWKGDSLAAAADGIGGLGMPIPVGGEKESRENREFSNSVFPRRPTEAPHEGARKSQR